MQISSVKSIHRDLSGATILGQKGPGSNGNEVVLQNQWNLTIRLFSVISRTLMGGGSYLFAEVQSMYSTAAADWAEIV